MDMTTTSDNWWSLGERPCSWCGTPFTVIRRPGRPRLYCNHTCRQRAYEHRHGFRHERTVLPLPGQAPGEQTGGCGYEQGGFASVGGLTHALRTSVRPEGRRRETVCGLLARPVPGRWFDPGGARSCRTCAQIVACQPLTHGISASNELSRLRSLIVEGIEHRHPDVQAFLTWLADDADPPQRGDRAA